MKICIIEGHPLTEIGSYHQYLTELEKKLVEGGHSVKVLTIREMDIRFCTGCWTCWWETPGECVFNDESYTVCREYINSDFVLFASPLIMGFISALMKKVQDKLIPLVHPYITFIGGECHHEKRYDSYPKVGLLLHRDPTEDDEDIKITVDMFKRFALNLRSDFAFYALTTQTTKEVNDAINHI